MTAHSLESLSRPDVSKSKSAIRLEKLQNQTVSRIAYFTTSYKMMPSTVGHQRANKCLLLVPFCESWQFMSSVSFVQYGIHNDVNPTTFCQGILQLRSISHCTLYFVQRAVFRTESLPPEDGNRPSLCNLLSSEYQNLHRSQTSSNISCGSPCLDVYYSHVLIIHTQAVSASSVPLQAWSGPEGSRKLRFPD